MLSAVIASAGILADSTAAVIGAMVIAPLGLPIMGAGLAVVTSDGHRVWTSAALALAGAAAVVLAGAFLAWALPELQALADNGQVTTRTAPSTIDLVAAVATGFAGSYGLARKDVSDIMPGVAIAISLVPPLAVAGITAAAGDWPSTWGALLLFAANVLAMIVAGTIVFTLYGYHRTARQVPGFRKRGAYVVIAVFVVAILVPLGLATAQTAREQAALTQAAATARPWAAGYGYALVDVRFEGPDLDVVIEGTGPEPPGGRLLAQLRGQVPAGTPVVVATIAGGLAPIGHVPALPRAGNTFFRAMPAGLTGNHHGSQEGVAAVSANQVLTGIALIVVLAVGSQVLASQLRIPALIVMLPAGFIAGLMTSDVNPSKLLGAAFQPLVSLSVALILYDAGLALDLHKLTGHTRKVVLRLIIVGVPLTWAVVALLSAPLLGISRGAALELGAILVVSGPTVVTPLLAFVRPVERLQRVLAWEGSLIDPVGGILGAVVFHGVLAGTHKHLGSQFVLFLGSIGIGLAGAIVGTAALWLLLRVLQLGEALGTSAQVAVVVGVAAACDVARDDSGLIAAILMGLALANMRAFDIPARRPFFETLVQLVIGLLFVSISATITPASLQHLVPPTLGLVAVLVLAVRPVVAALATLRTSLTRGERAFTGWMAPRGIVAAATATTFSASLSAHGVDGANKILPVTFLVIAITVAVYGLSAKPVARAVGVLTRPRARTLLVGGDPWVVDLGCALRSAGVDVLLWAGQEEQRERISQAQLELAQGELLASAAGQGAELEGVTAVLLLTDEDDFNALASVLLEAGEEGGTRVYRLGPPSKSHGVVAPFMGSDVLFGDDLSRTVLAARYSHGARITAQPGGHAVPDGYDLLFVLRHDGHLEPATGTTQPSPEAGETLVLLGPGR